MFGRQSGAGKRKPAEAGQSLNQNGEGKAISYAESLNNLTQMVRSGSVSRMRTTAPVSPRSSQCSPTYRPGGPTYFTMSPALSNVFDLSIVCTPYHIWVCEELQNVLAVRPLALDYLSDDCGRAFWRWNCLVLVLKNFMPVPCQPHNITYVEACFDCHPSGSKFLTNR